MLELKNISKSFGGVKALQNISVQFHEGEIHAILGENGAGKSTLMKIVCGIYQADQGEVILDGKKMKLNDYNDAIHNGISIVNQEINLIPESSIAENIVLDKMDQFTKLGFVNWNRINETAKKYMDMVGLEFDPKTPVMKLSAAHKQLIQIAKALSANAKVLMLDEPTSSLTQYEANILFNLVRELKKKGVIMIFVSHKLEEVMEICDKVTVCRDGQYIGTGDTRDLTKQQIIKMMIGRESNIHYRGRLDAENNPVALEAKHICSKLHGLQDLNFYVRRGEILGFYGLVGSGRSELARTVLGIDKMDSGEVYLNGERIQTRSFAESLHFSAGVVPLMRRMLKSGATVVTDTNMALAGISKPSLSRVGARAICLMAEESVAAEAARRGITRAQVSCERALALPGPKLMVCGNAPTFLYPLLERKEEEELAVIGVPVGFVNVVEAKQRLWESDIPCITALGRRGGSNVAAAIVNALLYGIEGARA